MKSQFSIRVVLAAALTVSATAQLASHAPTLAPEAGKAGPSFQPVDRPLLRVNGAVLTDRDLAREMVAMFPYARQHNGGVPQSMEADIRQGAAQMMVFEELVYQEAKRRNMTVTPARMERARVEFRKKFNSPAEYEQFVQEEFHGNRKLLQAQIERSLLIDELLKLEVANKSVVSVAEAKAYFDKNPERFRVPESFAFQSISILPPQNPTAGQLKEAHKRADDALRQAKATKTYNEFGLLAEKISEDDFRVMMGDHKVSDGSKLPPEVVKALSAMQPNQVSDIVKFDANDCTILRLNAHIPAGMRTFAEVKDSVRKHLSEEKAEQLRSALATKLSKHAKIEKL
jgi:hypothetical protein